MARVSAIQEVSGRHAGRFRIQKVKCATPSPVSRFLAAWVYCWCWNRIRELWDGIMTMPMSPAPASASAVQLDLDAPLTVARWRVIGNPIMAIPHFIFLYVLSAVLSVVTIIAWFAILFTGKYPPGLFDFAVGVMRYQWRVGTFYLFMREPYPAFGIPSGPADPGDDPAKFSITRPEKLSRGLIFIKWLLAIPVYIVLIVLGIGAYVVLLIGFFAVLFTGKWPAGLRKYVVGVARLGFRLNAYLYLMTD